MEKLVVYIPTRKRQQAAMTLVEVLVAMAIVVIVFAAVLPQIRAIRNSWASKRENVELIQNGRVLMDHITFNLAQANRVTAVSDSTETNGYIEFGNSDGNTMRYEVGASNYVQFGPAGNLSELAGPVSQLQFACYDACDLDTAITDVNQIRSVKVQSTFTNTGTSGRDQNFIARAYLRTNSLGIGSELLVTEPPGSEFEFDTANREEPALCRIDATHHLCAYRGTGVQGEGIAVVLIVDTTTWTIDDGPPLIFEPSGLGSAALARIDATNYLCAYTGPADHGWAVVLTVNTITWEVSGGTLFEFDAKQCRAPALSQIDSTDFLCAYPGSVGPGVDGGFATVLSVDLPTKTVTPGPPYVFDPNNTSSIALADIDGTHHLCAYSGGATAPGAAIILEVDTVSKTVAQEGSLFVFDPQQAAHNELCKIDQNHYLAAYRGQEESGKTFVFTLDTDTWAIGKGATIEYDTKSEMPALAWIKEDDFLCAYAGTTGGTGNERNIGKALVLSVNTLTDMVSKNTDTVHDPDEGANPALSKVDDAHFLCAYKGEEGTGYATILTIGAPILP
ncbi:MAG: prepilin-type N-terminal cleavage/methylation domain-containing protein [Planctomycetota bacterium]|nr:MAG: prepilin-type N-terminal cleavage/methylation domain-containing protein [Planctomycetota bacterium]